MAEFVIVTGMSGAGRSTAAASLEDLGWFVIDNLPPAVMPRVAELVSGPGGEHTRVALVVGRPGVGEMAELLEAIERLREGAHVVRVLFLDASDEVLVRRYEGTRRRHPRTGAGVEISIAQERKSLEPLAAVTDISLDTGELNANQLRSRIFELFGESLGPEVMRTTLMSFGFKYGLPLDVDMVFDVRFLPNPHWVDELREHTGLEAPVRDFVLEAQGSKEFIDKVCELVESLLPAYRKEGKTYLTIGIGCTGGKHRSVAITEELARRLRSDGAPIATFHRDRER